MRALRAEFNKAKPKIEALEGAASASRQEAISIRDLLGSLRKVTVPANVVSLARRLKEERASLAAAEKELASNEGEVDRLVKQIQSKPKLAPLQLALAAHDELERCRKESTEASESVEGKKAKELQAIARAKAAQEALDAAKTSLEERRNEHASHAVARTLKAGSPCPVCLQLVTSIPKRRVPGALDSAASN